MNQDTLVLLSGMAPKEPEQWALDEWGAKFEADYPKPWEPVGIFELIDASEACLLAKHGGELWFSGSIAIKHAEMISVFSTTDVMSWSAWRNECLSEFTRNEWPLLWAKKRMQAAANNQHKTDER